MSDSIRRTETTHVDEVKRTATASTQWFAERLNAKNNPTHPITHNNQLRFFVCGEEGFADIANDIRMAKESIDLCCWGFDPGMELVRGEDGTWPRGQTFGDLLIAAGKRFVTIRLLVWFDGLACGTARNMPGYSHGAYPRLDSSKPAELSAIYSLAMGYAALTKPLPYRKGQSNAPIKAEEIPLLAREEYCHSWYEAATHGLLQGIQVRTRHGSAAHIKASLRTERDQPGALTEGEIERAGLVHVGTHHQKPILIDFAFENGRKAVGYVMGLNSVTDYWDTAEHKLEDPRREQGGKIAAAECVQRPKCRQVTDCDQASRCAKLDQCVHQNNLASSETPASRKRCTALSACPQQSKCKSLTACVQAFRPGFLSMKPYQDYACRIGGGQSLIALYNNFVTAWDRAIDDRMHSAAAACVSNDLSRGCHAAPRNFSARPGRATRQCRLCVPSRKRTTGASRIFIPWRPARRRWRAAICISRISISSMRSGRST
jgi:hypothetical protein